MTADTSNGAARGDLKGKARYYCNTTGGLYLTYRADEVKKVEDGICPQCGALLHPGKDYPGCRGKWTGGTMRIRDKRDGKVHTSHEISYGSGTGYFVEDRETVFIPVKHAEVLPDTDKGGLTREEVRGQIDETDRGLGEVADKGEGECPECNGFGKIPRWSMAGAEDEDCPACGGTGKQVGKGEKGHIKKNLTTGEKGSAIERKIRSKNTNDYILVSTCDYERLSAHGWRVYRKKGSGKISVGATVNGKWARIARFILDAPNNRVVDHKDGDVLDNRRGNLRICTVAENNRNRKHHEKSKYKYKGVHRFEDGRTKRKWYSTIQDNGKQRYLGAYDTELGAAKAYDKSARELHGEFARLNFPNEVKV